MSFAGTLVLLIDIASVPYARDTPFICGAVTADVLLDLHSGRRNNEAQTAACISRLLSCAHSCQIWIVVSTAMSRCYRSCWKTMFLDRCHLRFDGIYVSRNTYIRTGIVEWRVKNPVHLVCYYRYYRFFPDGQLLYRTSPDVVSKVVSSLIRQPAGASKKNAVVMTGQYQLKVGLISEREFPGGLGTCACTATGTLASVI